MNPQDAIDLGREAMKACFMVGGPLLLASLVIGLLIGIVQAMTQVQDQTVSFVPKLFCVMAILALCLPWITDQIVDYGQQTLATPITHFHVTTPAKPAGFSYTADRRNFELPSTQDSDSHANRDESDADQKSPFTLPHYRYSRRPSENRAG